MVLDEDNTPAPVPGSLPLLGVSACLLGRPVRYDGMDKTDERVRRLAGYLQVIPLCPELEAGLGVPRPPIRLLREGEDHVLRRIEDGLDVSSPVRAALIRMGPGLANCSGLVLKARSPSCGVVDTPLWQGDREIGSGPGFLLRCLQPQMPVADEQMLADPVRCRDFLTRVFARVSGAQVPEPLLRDLDLL